MVEPERVKVDVYIRGLTDNIKGEVTSSKPANLNEAVRMAHKLMDHKSQARDERILEGKKQKWESFQSGNSSGKGNQRDNSRQTLQNNQRQGNARAMVTAPTDGKLPLYERCFTRHVGQCTIKCDKCGKVRHKSRYCKERNVATGANALPIPTCYDCGEQGHTRNRCPRKVKQEEVGEVRGRAYAIKDAEPKGPNVVTGTFLLNNYYDFVLFDSGSDSSFVDTRFSSILDIDPVKIGASYEVELADGRVLVKHDVMIVCGKKVVRIPYGNKMLIVESDKGVSRLKVISCIKTRKYVEQGCHLFLAYVMENKSKEKRLEDVLLVDQMALNNAQTKTNSSAFRSMLEKHQLTGPNFNEWFRALKLVVRTEKLQDVFETALPPAPAAGADAQALADWAVLFYRHNEVACLMLGTMSPKLYQQFEHNSPLEMVTELQKMYGKPPGVELQELVNMFHSCKQAEGQSVSDHVLLMKSYLDQLATLNYAFPDKVSISFILNSLSSEFQAFVQNYNMQSMEKTISEVHSLLIEFEKSIKRNKQQIVGASSTPHVMAIQSGRVQKNKPQGKAKGKEKGKGLKNSYPTKPKKPQPYKKERPAKDGQCHHCKEEGHWKRNCPLYLAELMKKKKTGGQNVASTSSGIYTIELFAFPKNSWVYDTGCGTHICNTKQGLRGAKKLKRGSLYLYVGNGVRAEVEAIGSFDLVLPNGLIIVLDNCHYAPSITRGVVSVSRLVNKDFLEKDFILQKESGRIVELEDEDILPSENTSEHPIEEESLAPIVSQEEDVIPVRRSIRTHKAPNRLCLNVEIDPDRLCFNVEVEEHSLGDLNEPANYKAALSDPEFEKWLVAMNAEMKSMYDNKVWRLVVLPPNAKVVKSKWIYKKKTNMDGKVHIYKARLVANGCTQTSVVDYEETFSPVADIGKELLDSHS
ncbi:putative retrotransposon protein [Tanacetum coccineum]